MHGNSSCSGCSGCSGGCPGSSGCPGRDGSLCVTEEEVAFLQRMAQLPFLPVGRKMGDLEPIFLEDGEEKREFYSGLLQCLEKKSLISLDYDRPLKGYKGGWYASVPIQGSVALTQRGQTVLELLEYQGAQ